MRAHIITDTVANSGSTASLAPLASGSASAQPLQAVLLAAALYALEHTVRLESLDRDLHAYASCVTDTQYRGENIYPCTQPPCIRPARIQFQRTGRSERAQRRERVAVDPPRGSAVIQLGRRDRDHAVAPQRGRSAQPDAEGTLHVVSKAQLHAPLNVSRTWLRCRLVPRPPARSLAARLLPPWARHGCSNAAARRHGGEHAQRRVRDQLLGQLLPRELLWWMLLLRLEERGAAGCLQNNRAVHGVENWSRARRRRCCWSWRPWWWRWRRLRRRRWWGRWRPRWLSRWRWRWPWRRRRLWSR